MRVLHIDASARSQGSHSRDLSSHFLAELKARLPRLDVDRLDLAINPPRHFGALEAAAVAAPETAYTSEMRAAMADSDTMIERVLAADILLIGSPIYNFGMPSTLKAFFDHIARNGKTFLSDESGMRGLLGDKKAAVLSAAGGAYGPGDTFEGMDMLTPHIGAILRFMGIREISFIAARPMMFAGPDLAGSSLATAKAEVEALAREWASD